LIIPFAPLALGALGGAFDAVEIGGLEDPSELLSVASSPNLVLFVCWGETYPVFTPAGVVVALLGRRYVV
jgi:hypothetical protein